MTSNENALNQMSIEDLCRLAFGCSNEEIVRAVVTSRIFRIYAFYRAEEKLHALSCRA